MTVAFVSPSWPPGVRPNGIASYVPQIFEGLRDCGVMARILVRGEQGEGTPDYVHRVPDWHEGRSRFARLCIRGGSRVLPSFFGRRLAAGSLLVAIHSLRADAGLQLVEMEESFGIAGHVARRSPVPIVVRLHGPWAVVGQMLGHQADSDFRQRVKAEGRAISAAAGVSAPSHDILRRVRDCYGIELPQAEVIPNPIVPVSKEDRWSLDRCDRDAILFVGRFDRVKAGDVLIDAFARLARHHPKARLVFVGPDRGCVDRAGRSRLLAEFIRERVPEAGVRARIECLGVCSPEQIHLLRSRCLATVVCSRYENCPMVLLEAMAAGCPVIASAVGGMREIIRHEENGLVCRAEDPHDLADQMVRLMKEPDLAARLGRQAAIDAEERYHPRKIAELTLEFYGRVLERWSRGGR